MHPEKGTRVASDERITRLHEVVPELQSASTDREVFEAIIDAAVKTLGFDSCAVSVPDDDVFDERVVSESAPFDEGTRSYRLDEGLIGKAYQEGDSILVDDAFENEDAKPSDESIVSGLTVPLEERAVFQGYANEAGRFDESDLEVAELLCAHAAAALERIEREQKLQRKNEQLEQFADFVSHDLRNPLNVAELRLELAREECDSTHLEDVTYALERMETLIEELLALAKAGSQLNEVEPIALDTLATACWQTVDTGDATLVVGTTQTVKADRNRLRQLLENLFRNAIEHGSVDPDSVPGGDGARDASCGGPVTITVGDLEADGFFVADDGPGIPTAHRETVFESGYSTATDGTGYGLAIVAEIVKAHDWSVALTESAAGGARFEIST